MLSTVYGNDCLSFAREFERHKRFSEDRENVEDEERPGTDVISRTEIKSRY